MTMQNEDQERAIEDTIDTVVARFYFWSPPRQMREFARECLLAFAASQRSPDREG